MREVGHYQRSSGVDGFCHHLSGKKGVEVVAGVSREAQV